MEKIFKFPNKKTIERRKELRGIHVEPAIIQGNAHIVAQNTEIVPIGRPSRFANEEPEINNEVNDETVPRQQHPIENEDPEINDNEENDSNETVEQLAHVEQLQDEQPDSPGLLSDQNNEIESREPRRQRIREDTVEEPDNANDDTDVEEPNNANDDTENTVNSNEAQIRRLWIDDSFQENASIVEVENNEDPDE